MQNSFFRKLDTKFELSELEKGLKIALPLFDHRNQVCVNSEPGVENPLYYNLGGIKGIGEPVCSEINPQFKDTVFEKILNCLDCKSARARVMRLGGRSCYSMHWDTTPRFHIALQTHPTSYLFFHDHIPFHLPKDGHIYWVDTRKPHSAINCGTEPRYHFVVVDPFSEGLPKGGYL
ncbi:MAG: hypothetical protein AB7O96_08365 [Pseudobdellovibrionaceae bacterium]